MTRNIRLEHVAGHFTVREVMGEVRDMIKMNMHDSLSEHARRRLALAAEDAEPYIGIEFERNDRKASCSLFVNVADVRDDREYVRDIATGDDYKIYRGDAFRAQVSWPSWGSDTIENNVPRIKLMQDTMKLAAQIERFIHPMTKIIDLICTKQEREEAEARQRELTVQFNVKRAVEEVMKGMRVLSERVALFTNVPKGAYQVDIGGKRFRAIVTEELADPTTPGATSKGTIIRCI